MKLSPRLSTIADMLPAGLKAADIGTDHAYLPVELILQNKTNFIVAGDVHVGPYQAAQLHVRQAGLLHNISVRLGDGLAVLAPGEVDAVILAGMGGVTMAQILSASPAVTAKLSVLILQPMNGAALLRQWLVNQGWNFDAETLVQDDGRLYEIIRVIHSNKESSETFDALLYEVGPLLWRNRHPLLAAQLTLKIQAMEVVLREIGKATALSDKEKARQYRDQLGQLKEMLACL